MVSPAKQIWKCFSSGKGGNVVSFLMEHEHFSYVEALKWLAQKYNIEIKEDRERTPEEIAAYSERENLSIINEFARDHFAYNLENNEQGKAIGRSYFIERGFREDIITKFQLGYCLDESDGFTKQALSKKYKLEFLEKAGLTKSKDGRTLIFLEGESCSLFTRLLAKFSDLVDVHSKPIKRWRNILIRQKVSCTTNQKFYTAYILPKMRS